MNTILLRKGWMICALLLVLILMCGCDVYAGKRPNDYPDSVWYCNEENMRIIVNADGTSYFTFGEEIETRKDDPEYTVLFSYGDEILIVHDPTDREYISSEDTVMKGECSFSSKKLKVRIVMDNLFDGKYHMQTLIFYRQ